MLSVEINKEDWDQKQFEWQEKPFYRVKYTSLLGMPLTKELKETKALQMLSEQDMLPGKPIILRKNDSMFGGELFIELKNADIEHEKMSGDFFTMVFEGNNWQMPAWKKTMQQVAAGQGMDISDIMLYHASSHAKKSMVVLIGQVR